MSWSPDGTRSPRYAGRMPAPLGKTPTKKMPDIQVFGSDGSPSTRAALRFFRERRIVVRYSDLRKRPIAPGELRRFVERLGLGHCSMRRRGRTAIPAWAS